MRMKWVVCIKHQITIPGIFSTLKCNVLMPLSDILLKISCYFYGVQHSPYHQSEGSNLVFLWQMETLHQRKQMRTRCVGCVTWHPISKNSPDLDAGQKAEKVGRDGALGFWGLLLLLHSDRRYWGRRRLGLDSFSKFWVSLLTSSFFLNQNFVAAYNNIQNKVFPGQKQKSHKN